MKVLNTLNKAEAPVSSLLLLLEQLLELLFELQMLLCDPASLLLVLQLLFEGLFFEFSVLFVFYSLFLLAALQELFYSLSWAHFALESQFFGGFLGQTLEFPLLK